MPSVEPVYEQIALENRVTMRRGPATVFHGWPGLAIALLAMVPALVACRGGEDRSESDTREPNTGTAEPTAGEQGDVSLPEGMSMVEFQNLLDEANDFVLPIIRDGHITPSEYEAAVLQVLACLDEEGVPHSEPELVETGDGPRWNYSVGPSRDDQTAEHGRIHDECDLEYLRPVLSIWVYQEQLSVSEQRALDERFLQCLRDKGIDTSTLEEVEVRRREGLLSGEQQADYIECLSETG